jgi:hypothetical protein
MTTSRAAAYRRILTTLRDLGPAKLLAEEQSCLRDAADTLLFCRDISTDLSARNALAAVAALADHLGDAGRWSPEQTARLFDDIWACGPGAVELRAAA